MSAYAVGVAQSKPFISVQEYSALALQVVRLVDRVGFPGSNEDLHFLNTRGRALSLEGVCFDKNERAVREIASEDFEKLDIRAGTIEEMDPIAFDHERSYIAKVNLGLLGTKMISIVDINPAIAFEILGTQMPVVINIKKDCILDPNEYAVTFHNGQERVPLGIDGRVEDGSALRMSSRFTKFHAKL